MDKSVRNQIIGLIIVLLVVLLVVISFIAYNQWPLLTGTSIVLATAPVDPFDPFLGQYMQIRYEISTVQSIEGVKSENKVYVSLKEDNGSIWRLDSVSLTKPRKGVFIRGDVGRVYGDSMSLNYGIEKFFFERNAELPTTNITVEVKVASSGRASLFQLLHNGEPIEIKEKDLKLTS
ncbi:MAG: GDYXXLXY domain-containing protein [archaeon]